jgi:hypothetical protein
MFNMATGSGKTMLMAACILALYESRIQKVFIHHKPNKYFR